MKTSPYAVDRKKFEAFWERINAEAKLLFPDDGDGSLVSVHLCDRSRHSDSFGVPEPRLDLIEDDHEWLEAISIMSINSNAASERLRQAVKLWEYDKNEWRKQKAFVEELQQLAKKLNVALLIQQTYPSSASSPNNAEIVWAPIKIDGLINGFRGMGNSYYE